MMRFIRAALLVLVILAVAMLTWLNTASIELNYLLGHITVPLPIALWGSLAIGVLLGIVASLGMLLRLKAENARLRRSARLAETEVNNLRNLPIKDGR